MLIKLKKALYKLKIQRLNNKLNKNYFIFKSSFTNLRKKYLIE